MSHQSSFENYFKNFDYPIDNDNSNKKILVLCATGKVGKHVCIALKNAGFDVYGTTRNVKNNLASFGIKPILCDYTQRYDLYDALKTSGCKLLFMITDYFHAAHKSINKEVQQGKMMIDAAVNAGCKHVIYSSAGDADKMGPKVTHITAKPIIEKYLLKADIPFVSIVRPVAFFENFDDPVNWNPLVKGKITFLTDCKVKYCSTYDVGKAAAIMFANSDHWNSKILEIASWEGDLAQVAESFEKVSGVKTVSKMAMPRFFRYLFLNDLHNMCLYFENGYPNTNVNIDSFRKIVPDCMNAEDWFRFQKKYSNGESYC
jgi:uncharacterized protein YbjT (DUF2867 family)